MDRDFRAKFHDAATFVGIKQLAAGTDENPQTLAAKLNPNHIGTRNFRPYDVGDFPKCLETLETLDPNRGTRESKALGLVADLGAGIGAHVFFIFASGDAVSGSLADVLKEFGEMVGEHAKMDADQQRDLDEVEKVCTEATQVQEAIEAYKIALRKEAARD